jgi:predicted ATPase with chaperone activity
VPIRDRIDINQAYLPLRKAYLKKATPQRAESSAAVAERVQEARDRQRRRWQAAAGKPMARCPEPTCAVTCHFRTAWRSSTKQSTPADSAPAASTLRIRGGCLILARMASPGHSCGLECRSLLILA